MGRRRETERAAWLLARGTSWANVVAQSMRPLDQDLIREQAKLVIARDQRRFQRKQARLLRQSQVFGVCAGVFAGVGIYELASADAGFLGLFAGGAVTGALSFRAWRHRRNLTAPTPAPLPPPSLRPSAIGASEAARLAHVRAQLGGVIPAVSGLHPDAGAELQRADDEAAKAFAPLVERLQVLDRIRSEMPGGLAADSATASARNIAERLEVGVDSYERLLASAATMLGSPDIVAKGISNELQDAAQALMAYSHGLGIAAAGDLPLV